MSGSTSPVHHAQWLSKSKLSGFSILRRVHRFKPVVDPTRELVKHQPTELRAEPTDQQNPWAAKRWRWASEAAQRCRSHLPNNSGPRSNKAGHNSPKMIVKVLKIVGVRPPFLWLLGGSRYTSIWGNVETIVHLHAWCAAFVEGQPKRNLQQQVQVHNTFGKLAKSAHLLCILMYPHYCTYATILLDSWWVKSLFWLVTVNLYYILYSLYIILHSSAEVQSKSRKGPGS